ncbi:uncharacterized protein IUM83_12542 [Phytophthora cinnamomi]|uniref:uncharacterized protein n=1 Tax=Phytophthora cinnamomi TaxID=4785 RepID=UPI003559CE1A|nr:hypothetical protein IUM83_12542 [Phytophthora cinnamomi]
MHASKGTCGGGERSRRLGCPATLRATDQRKLQANLWHKANGAEMGYARAPRLHGGTWCHDCTNKNAWWGDVCEAPRAVQANLNHTPVVSLGNCAPVELFTGLPAPSALDVSEQRHTAAMARSKGTVCNFSEGDYVLWSRVDQRLQGGKLLVRWVGPFQVYDVHGSRLKSLIWSMCAATA